MPTDTFRLALLTGSGQVARWIWEPIESAIKSADISLVLRAELDPRPIRSRRPWILDFYAKWEPSHNRSNALLDDVPIPAMPGVEVLRLSKKNWEQLSLRCIAHQVDALLVSPDVDQVSGTTSVPVWRFQFGDGPLRKHIAPGFWETVERLPIFISLTETAPGSAAAHALETIIIRTDPRSWVRSMIFIVNESGHLLRRWLPPRRNRRREAPLMQTIAVPKKTGSLAATAAVGKQIARLVRHGIANALVREQWQLAVDDAPQKFRLVNPQLLIPPRDRFWADPFPLLRNGTLYVFFEDYSYRAFKGVISVISRNAAGEWSEPMEILNRPYHLSYPFIFEEDNALYMLPETSGAGRIELYRCVEFPSRWQLDSVLLPDFCGVDPTLVYHNDIWWLFIDSGAGLHLFFAKSFQGPWTEHPGNPIKSDSRSQRPAGRIFREGKYLLRPAQDCSVDYGRAVVFNRILKLSEEAYEETEVGRLRLPWKPGIASHTYNQTEGIAVVDRRVLRRKK